MKAILHEQPFSLDSFKQQLALAQQLTGIRPPPKTTTPLRKCLDRYFAASLEVNTLEAIQDAMYDLSMRWCSFLLDKYIGYTDSYRHPLLTKKALRAWEHQYHQTPKRWCHYCDDGKTEEEVELEREEKRKWRDNEEKRKDGERVRVARNRVTDPYYCWPKRYNHEEHEAALRKAEAEYRAKWNEDYSR